MNDTKKIKITDLKQGDILLFSPVDEWDSKLIALLTQSPVSHSAMSYYNYNEIVEETPPYAQVNQIKDRIINRTITVMRLNTSSKLDMSKVLSIAQNYVTNKEPYSKMNLIFIALFILLKKTTINLELQKLLVPLMRHIMADLIKFFDKELSSNPHPMVCSQFVYSCYELAGDEYKIKINSSSSKNLLDRIQEYITENKGNLESKLIDNINSITIDNELTSIDEEKILKEIYNQLQSEISTKELNITSSLHEEFVIATHEFCSVINHVFAKNKESTLIDKNDKSIISKSIKIINDDEEFFVTPGDLLTNSQNLICIGNLDNN